MKGGAFEREMCKELSWWWSGDTRDDIFWRSSNSGGRATVRSSKGKRTEGAYGDIAATDPSGAPLLKFVTLELKRGYSRCTVAELLDRTVREKSKGMELFIEQAMAAGEAAGSFGWLLIQRRDKKRAMVFFPVRVFNALRGAGAFKQLPSVFIRLSYKSKLRGVVSIGGMLLDDFFKGAHPAHIVTMVKGYEL